MTDDQQLCTACERCWVRPCLQSCSAPWQLAAVATVATLKVSSALCIAE